LFKADDLCLFSWMKEENRNSELISTSCWSNLESQSTQIQLSGLPSTNISIQKKLSSLTEWSPKISLDFQRELKSPQTNLREDLLTNIKTKRILVMEIKEKVSVLFIHMDPRWIFRSQHSHFSVLVQCHTQQIDQSSLLIRNPEMEEDW